MQKRELVVGSAIACWAMALNCVVAQLVTCTYMDIRSYVEFCRQCLADSLCRCVFVRPRFVNLICCIL